MEEYSGIVLGKEELQALTDLQKAPAERSEIDAAVWHRLKSDGLVQEYFLPDSPSMLRITDRGRGFLEYDKARRRESRKEAIKWVVSITGGLIAAAYYLLQILGN